MVKPPNRSHVAEADWTPVPEVPMESVAIDKFTMLAVRQGKEIYDCVVVCVDRHSGNEMKGKPASLGSAQGTAAVR